MDVYSQKNQSALSLSMCHTCLSKGSCTVVLCLSDTAFKVHWNIFRRASVLVICLRTYWNWSSAFPSVIILYRLLCLIKGESQTAPLQRSKTESAFSPFWLQNKPNLAVKLIFSICHFLSTSRVYL